MRHTIAVLLVGLVGLVLPVRSHAAQVPLKNPLLQSNLDGGGHSLTNLDSVISTNGIFDLLTLDGFNLASLTNLIDLDLTQFQPASETLTNIVNTITVDTNGTLEATNLVAQTLTIGGVDLTGGLANKMDASVTASDIEEGPGRVWIGTNAFGKLYVAGAVEYGATTNTGPAQSYDESGAMIQFFDVDEDVVIDSINEKSDSGFWRLPTAVIRGTAATNCAIVLPDGWVLGGRTNVGGIVPSVILPGEQIFIWLERHLSLVPFHWRGQQEDALPPPLGGTGNQYGVADVPEWKVFVTIPLNGTNYSAEFGQGTVAVDSDMMFIKFWTNIVIMTSSTRPDATGREKRLSMTFFNTNAPTETNYVSVRDEWPRIGFPDGTNTITVPGGSIAEFEFRARGPYETNVLVKNELATTFTLASGGEPPVGSTLTNGIIEFWTFDESSGNILGQVNSHDLVSLRSSGSWVYSRPGVIGNAVSNTTSAGTFTNGNTAFDVGQSGESWTYTTVFASNEGVTRYLGGKGNYTTAFSWVYRLESGGGRPQLYIADYTDGNGIGASVLATDAISTATWYLAAVQMDRASGNARISITPISASSTTVWNTVAYDHDTYDSAGGLTVGGAIVSGAVSSFVGTTDETAVWSRALSQSELDELLTLYKAGNSLSTLYP